MSDTKDVVIGMRRALNAMENCDGDLDFAIYIVKRDISEMESPKPSMGECPECGHELIRHLGHCRYIGDCGGRECGCQYKLPKIEASNER